MDHQEEPELTPSRPAPDAAPKAAEAVSVPLEVEEAPAESPELEPSGDTAAETPAEPEAPAAEPPPEPGPAAAAPASDNRTTKLLIGAAVAVVVLLSGAAFLWKTYSDLGALRQEVAVLKAQTQRAQTVQQRGAILRVRAELQTLRQTLPPDLSLDVDKAEALLVGVDERLKASR